MNWPVFLYGELGSLWVKYIFSNLSHIMDTCSVLRPPSSWGIQFWIQYLLFRHSPRNYSVHVSPLLKISPPCFELYLYMYGRKTVPYLTKATPIQVSYLERKTDEESCFLWHNEMNRLYRQTSCKRLREVVAHKSLGPIWSKFCGMISIW